MSKTSRVKLWPIFECEREVSDERVVSSGRVLLIFSWRNEKLIEEPVVTAAE